MPRHYKIDNFNAKDTVDGLLFFYPDDGINVFLTTDKAEVDDLKAKLREEQGHMDKFWKDLEPKTNIIPVSSFSKVGTWTTILKESGCEDRVPEFEKLHSALEDINTGIRNFNMYARKMQRIVLGASEDKREDAIKKVKKMIATAEARRKPGRDLEDKDEYALEERALMLLEQYPAKDIQHLLDIGRKESSSVRFPSPQRFKDWTSSVQGDMLLLTKTIQQLKDGKRTHQWAVGVPDLDSEEYSHIKLLRDSDVFTTKTVKVSRKEALMKQAEQELDKELGSAE